jgi:hypothetical protein
MPTNGHAEFLDLALGAYPAFAEGQASWQAPVKDRGLGTMQKWETIRRQRPSVSKGRAAVFLQTMLTPSNESDHPPVRWI